MKKSELLRKLQVNSRKEHLCLATKFLFESGSEISKASMEQIAVHRASLTLHYEFRDLKRSSVGYDRGLERAADSMHRALYGQLLSELHELKYRIEVVDTEQAKKLVESIIERHASHK